MKSITDRLDAMYEKGDYSELYSDPRLFKEDVWFDDQVELLGSMFDDEYFIPIAANYIIEDYLESHDLEDIELMGGNAYSGGSVGEEAAEIIVSSLLGKNYNEIREQLGSWTYTNQL